MDDAAERELIRRAREGGDTAFRQLIEEYQRFVFALISRIGGPAVPTDRLAQEVFVQIRRGLPYYRGQARIATWIYRVVVSVCASHAEATVQAALDEHADERRLIAEAESSAAAVRIPERFVDSVLKRTRRDWLQAEERIDRWFNAALILAGVCVILVVLFVVQRTGIVPIFADVFRALTG
jgi:DNA-directed RNA polymerase specialized sigma24 family protein